MFCIQVHQLHLVIGNFFSICLRQEQKHFSTDQQRQHNTRSWSNKGKDKNRSATITFSFSFNQPIFPDTIPGIAWFLEGLPRRTFRDCWSRISYKPDALPVIQPIVSGHWMVQQRPARAWVWRESHGYCGIPMRLRSYIAGIPRGWV